MFESVQDSAIQLSIQERSQLEGEKLGNTDDPGVYKFPEVDSAIKVYMQSAQLDNILLIAQWGTKRHHSPISITSPACHILKLLVASIGSNLPAVDLRDLVLKWARIPGLRSRVVTGRQAYAARLPKEVSPPYMSEHPTLNKLALLHNEFSKKSWK